MTGTVMRLPRASCPNGMGSQIENVSAGCEGRRGRSAQVRVVVGHPHRHPASIAAVGCADAGHDDLDLVDAELLRDDFPLREHVGGRLPATPGQVEDHRPASAVTNRAHRARNPRALFVALAAFQEAGRTKRVVELLRGHVHAERRRPVVEQLSVLPASEVGERRDDRPRNARLQHRIGEHDADRGCGNTDRGSTETPPAGPGTVGVRDLQADRQLQILGLGLAQRPQRLHGRAVVLRGQSRPQADGCPVEPAGGQQHRLDQVLRGADAVVPGLPPREPAERADVRLNRRGRAGPGGQDWGVGDGQPVGERVVRAVDRLNTGNVFLSPGK